MRGFQFRFRGKYQSFCDFCIAIFELSFWFSLLVTLDEADFMGVFEKEPEAAFVGSDVLCAGSAAEF